MKIKNFKIVQKWKWAESRWIRMKKKPENPVEQMRKRMRRRIFQTRAVKRLNTEYKKSANEHRNFRMKMGGFLTLLTVREGEARNSVLVQHWKELTMLS